MARKVRRIKPSSTEEVATTASATPAPPPKSREETLREEYGYVVRDLRQIFILAAALFLLLIVLNVLL